MEIFIIILLSIVSLVFLAIIINLYNKLNAIENAFNEQYSDTALFYKLILGVVVKAYGELENIDKKGAFKSDDEVGFIFGIIKGIIQETIEKLKKVDINAMEEIGNE